MNKLGNLGLGWDLLIILALGIIASYGYYFENNNILLLAAIGSGIIAFNMGYTAKDVLYR